MRVLRVVVACLYCCRQIGPRMPLGTGRTRWLACIISFSKALVVITVHTLFDEVSASDREGMVGQPQIK